VSLRVTEPFLQRVIWISKELKVATWELLSRWVPIVSRDKPMRRR
jgi:hypothetical protein